MGYFDRTRRQRDSEHLFGFFISLNLASKSIERLINPLLIKSDGLLTISIGGLLINFVGLFFTRPQIENNSEENDQNQRKSDFMKSIYSHVMTDTLGSVLLMRMK